MFSTPTPPFENLPDPTGFYRVVLGAACVLVALGFVASLFFGCAPTRPIPPLLRPVNLDSLERVAQLPPYLVPPPAQASHAQVQAWRTAQTQALGNINAPIGKLKLKNVGNTADRSRTQTTVQHGVTGRQVSIGFVVVAVIALLLYLGPRLIRAVL